LNFASGENERRGGSYFREIKMKRLVIVTAAVLISGAAVAKENANCFGQGRSDYASNHPGMGQIISTRAQTESTDGSPNQNVQMNREYKAGQGFCEANPS